jgi:hypothetical protein
MKHRSKFSQDQQHVETHQTQPAGHEFATAEELLRFDAGQTDVPPEIAARLKRTTAAAAPPPTSSWLKRIFGGNHQ